MTVHNFDDSQEFERSQQNKPFVLQTYRTVYPEATDGFLEVTAIAQKFAVDRVLKFPKTHLLLMIEEKHRTYPYEGDVLLEIYSNLEKKTPGWFVGKYLICQVLAYFWSEPEEIAILFDWRKLRTLAHWVGHDWVFLANHKRVGFRWVRAQNPTYTTLSLVVPTRCLFPAVIYDSTGAWHG